MDSIIRAVGESDYLDEVADTIIGLWAQTNWAIRVCIYKIDGHAGSKLFIPTNFPHS